MKIRRISIYAPMRCVSRDLAKFMKPSRNCEITVSLTDFMKLLKCLGLGLGLGVEVFHEITGNNTFILHNLAGQIL